MGDMNPGICDYCKKQVEHRVFVDDDPEKFARDVCEPCLEIEESKKFQYVTAINDRIFAVIEKKTGLLTDMQINPWPEVLHEDYSSKLFEIVEVDVMIRRRK